MGRVLEALVLLGILVAIAWLATVRWNARIRARSLKDAPWALTEHSPDGELLAIYAERPGEKSILIGSEACNNPEFEYRIEEVRARGRQKIAALNSGRSR